MDLKNSFRKTSGYIDHINSMYSTTTLVMSVANTYLRGAVANGAAYGAYMAVI